jgi:hypothetical protein
MTAKEKRCLAGVLCSNEMLVQVLAFAGPLPDRCCCPLSAVWRLCVAVCAWPAEPLHL